MKDGGEVGGVGKEGGGEKDGGRGRQKRGGKEIIRKEEKEGE